MTEPSVKQLHVGPMQNLAYLVGDDEANVCAVIDPGWNAKLILSSAKEAGWKIEKILLTHGHFDHTGALKDIIEKTDASIYVHKEDAGEIDEGLALSTPEDEDIIKLGNMEIRCIHTPGHTPGSQCFFVQGSLFTGDTLFVGAVGRVDLPGGSRLQMRVSFREKIFTLPADTTVWPGHDYGPSPTSTIGHEQHTNPFIP